MKRLISAVGYILFSLLALLPFGVVICDICGYSFDLANYNIFAVFTAISAVIKTIFAVSDSYESSDASITHNILLSLSSPLSIINAVFYLWKCNSSLVAACMLICTVLCFFLASNHGKPFALKTASLILSFIMFLPALSVSLYMMFPFGETTVVKELPSPDNTRYVQVIDSDQGALGGDTIVCLYENKGVDLLILSITKKPEIFSA